MPRCLMTAPVPSKIHYHKKARELELTYADGKSLRLTVEYLRVFSPSAEVRGHYPRQRVLQVGKNDVGLKHIEPVGRYAVKLAFDDGHDSGLYSWEYLYVLLQILDAKWADYLLRLEQAGASLE